LPTLISYAPRWIWGCPALLLLPATVWKRSAALPVILSLAITGGPLMQFQFGSMHAVAPAAAPLRLLTFNAASKNEVADGLISAMIAEQPDIVAIQECPPAIKNELSKRAEWSVDSFIRLCVASRFGLDRRITLDRSALGGSDALALQHTIATPAGEMQLVNLHLETVRQGLQPLLERDPNGIDLLQGNFKFRELESIAVNRFITAPDRAVIAGDFNMPTDSALYRRHWSNWLDAFEAVGSGYGYTKFTRWHGIRIDHVLLGTRWRAVSAETIAIGGGSDHHAVLVTLTSTKS